MVVPVHAERGNARCGYAVLGGSLFICEGVELVHQTLGVDPA
jgi:hypothetical protein